MIALRAISRHPLRGEEDHGGAAETLVGAQFLQQAVTITARHHRVADHEVRHLLLGFFPAIQPIDGSADLKSFVFQIGLNSSSQPRLIINKQQARHRL